MLAFTAVRKLMHGSIVLVVSLAYLSYVFQLYDAGPRSSGLGDWLDPYFINALLEHWYRSAANLSDPSSPVMYFPAQKTLGYSHGLVLYAAFYVPLRLFVHPFQAHTLMLFAVIETGILCLYLLFRKLGLAFAESLSLSALLFSSQNVVNGGTGVWSQRASVFLIPPILLLLVVSARMRHRRLGVVIAGCAGLLSTLMYVQDFYTAHFASLFAVLFGAAAVCVDGRLGERSANFWKTRSRATQLVLIAAAVTVIWSCGIGLLGGGELHILGVRLRSHDWKRPALLALVALLAFAVLDARTRTSLWLQRRNAWLLALCTGAAAGAAVFLWMYVGAYREHRAFSEEELLRQLLVRDPSRWGNPLDFLRDLNAYDTVRSFVLVIVVGTLAWIPRFEIDRSIRICCVWLLAISFVVLLIPLRFPDFSVWRVVFERLPGFGVIRDPKRIIHLYELAVVVAVALILTRLPRKSVSRVSITLLVLVLIVTDRNPEVFGYERANDAYERWVGAPIEMDRRCASFYIKGASAEYMSRPGRGHMWSLYGIDAVFVSLNHTSPTLNGYSAWVPDGWELHNPHEPSYDERVMRWIQKHQLTGVCELDIDARTMKVRIP